MKKRVLVLCTGNSCRSQMAEAIINGQRGGAWEAFSAGTKPAAVVHPRAIEALEEINIHADGLEPKSVDVFKGHQFDLVITVCDDAAEHCPVWLGQGKRAHVAFPDPAKATGTDDEIMAAFRDVRNGIVARILPLLDDSTV